MYAAQSKNRIKNERVQLYCVLYLVVWLLAPPLAYGTIYRLLAIVAAFVWLGLQIFREPQKGTDPQSSRRLTTYLFCMCIYLVAVLFLECFIEERSILSVLLKNITTYILLFIGYIGGVYVAEKREKDLRIIFYCVLIIAVVFSITSLLRSEEFYEYTRAAGGEQDDAYYTLARRAAAQGVGAFGFFCFSSVFAPLILWVYFKKQKWRYLLAFIIVEIGVVSAGYTIALLVSLLGAIFCFMVNSKSAFSKVFVILIALTLLVFWNIISEELYSLLYRIAKDSHYQEKVIDIFRFILEGESVNTFDARIVRYMRSLKSIVQYPFLGSYILAGEQYSGYHSSILDTFSIYGWLLGGIWSYLIVVFPIAHIRRSFENAGSFCFMAGALLFLTALLNQYVMMMAVFYFIFPSMSILFSEQEETSTMNGVNNESTLDYKFRLRASRRIARK